jgi:GDP/UDP-N,N'-diacetylbacillosamine 2-epimerase (hydrolysing)
MNIKKICIVTTSRAEYGVIRWLIDEINKDGVLELQLLVTGGHLSPEFGYTYKEIENDGFFVYEKIDMLLTTTNKANIAKSMGIEAIGCSDVLERLNPDLIIVTGDRYELLPICNSALVMDIPIAHISGGDVTEGAIDNQIRNAISALAKYHFPGNPDSGNRLLKMGADPEYVHVVGEPALDNFNRLNTLNRHELAKRFNLDINKKWILLTYHSETKLSLQENLSIVSNILESLKTTENSQIIITKSNADYGGKQINDYLKKEVEKNKSSFSLYDNLGQLNYISLMKEVSCIIGNSSSGIIEAPSVKCPVINIGNRQKGRLLSNNIICCKGSNTEISLALEKIYSEEFKSVLNETETPYGDGNSTERIIQKIKHLLNIRV